MNLTLQATTFNKFMPMFDRILVQRLAAETKTKGGVLIPEKAQSKVQSGTVMAVGPGMTTDVSDCTCSARINFSMKPATC